MRALFRVCVTLAVLGTGAAAGQEAGPVPARVPPSLAPVPPAGAGGTVEDADVPYGVAASWLIGHRLLAEGDAAAALPYLHMAYRAQPDVPLVAGDFLAALRGQGYLDNALEVADQLVTSFPDSLGFLFLRSALFVQRSEPQRALADLQNLRAAGGSTPQSVLAEASLLTSLDEPSRGLAVLQEGLSLFPEAGADLYLGLAAALGHNDQQEQVPDLMQEAIAAYPEDPRLRLVLIQALVEAGRDDRARSAARAADADFGILPAAGPGEGAPGAAAPEPGGPDASAGPAGMPQDSFQVELADAYAQRGQMAKSMAILEELSAAGALQLEPSLWLGRMLLGTGRLAEGTGLIDEIRRRWPHSGRAWFLKGKIEEGAGNWPGTLTWYRQAAVLAPQDAEIRVSLVRGMLLAWERDLRPDSPDSAQTLRRQEFREHAMAASALVPDQDTDGQLVLGYAFRALGDLPRAAWRFGLAAEDPDVRLNALIQASLCYDDMGETGKALTALETLRRESPDNPEIANSLGYFLAEKNQDLARAETLIKEALLADPNNGAYLDSLGWVCYRLGRLDDALDFLVRAVNVQPEDPVILEHLGVVLKDQGQPAEARDILLRALGLGGDRARLQALLNTLPPAAGDGER